MADRLVAGRYRLVSRLGSGAMGQVWRAVDERLRRDVAIKLVDLSTATDAATAERFQREAVAAASLNHRTIVTVFDTGRDGATAFLVMELLGGRSLAEIIRADGPLSVAEASRVGAEVAQALEATHAVGLVHRDIKPANIMVDGPSVKVLDFGIAKLAQDAAHLTATATTIGTAAYMSPEQAQGLPAGPASDVYSLGCVLMAVLTGQPPFPGDNPIQVASRQITDPAPGVRSRRPDVPPALDALVARMLAKDPLARPGASEVRAALGGAAAQPAGPPPTAVLPVAGATATVPLAAVPFAASASPRPSPREDVVWTPPPDDSGFKKAARWIALLITALLVVGILWALGSNLVNGLLAPASPPVSPPPTATKPRTPSPSPTKTSTRPTAAPIPLPSLPTLPTLPSIPSGLQVAVGAVDAAIDNINTEARGATKAQKQLKDAWETASEQILEGRNAQKALDQFSRKLDDQKDEISTLEYVALQAALKGVSLAL